MTTNKDGISRVAIIAERLFKAREAARKAEESGKTDMITIKASELRKGDIVIWHSGSASYTAAVSQVEVLPTRVVFKQYRSTEYFSFDLNDLINVRERTQS